jgi:hypothetical protein
VNEATAARAHLPAHRTVTIPGLYCRAAHAAQTVRRGAGVASEAAVECCYQPAMRYASLTVQTSADGHIVIATSAKIESQIGVLGTPAASSAGRLTAAPLRPATGLRCVRAGAWRATLLAREIGTTLLFIRSPTCRRRDGLRQKHLPNRDKIPLGGSPVSTGSAAVLGLAEVIFRSRYLGLKVIRLLAPKIGSSLSLRTKPFSDFFARCGKESKRNFFWSPARVTTRDAAKEIQQ